MELWHSPGRCTWSATLGFRQKEGRFTTQNGELSYKNVGIYQETVGVIFAMAVKFYKKTLAEKDTRTYVFFFFLNLKNWRIHAESKRLHDINQ